MVYSRPIRLVEEEAGTERLIVALISRKVRNHLTVEGC
jgi:hypothetical protein